MPRPPPFTSCTRKELANRLQYEFDRVNVHTLTDLSQLQAHAKTLHTQAMRAMPLCKITMHTVAIPYLGAEALLVLRRWHRYSRPVIYESVRGLHCTKKTLQFHIQRMDHLRGHVWMAEVALQRLETWCAPLLYCYRIARKTWPSLWQRCQPAVQALQHAMKQVLVHRWAQRCHLHHYCREAGTLCSFPHSTRCLSPDWHPEARGDLQDVLDVATMNILMPSSYQLQRNTVTSVLLPCRCCKLLVSKPYMLSMLSPIRYQLYRTRHICHNLFEHILRHWLSMSDVVSSCPYATAWSRGRWRLSLRVG